MNAMRALRMLTPALLLSAACAVVAVSGNAAQPGPAAAGACAPAPLLVLSEDFADPRGAFAPGAAAFRRTQANFAAAYRRTCARGLLRRGALFGAGAGPSDRLFLKNAPDANIASIYIAGEEGAPPAGRRIVLEYFFLTADGAVHVPSARELGHAILCNNAGASGQATEDILECLPD